MLLEAPQMRFLFSSTRGTGHLQPLLPYAHALQARGHEVRVAAPAEAGEPLLQAGFVHSPFDHPGDDTLAPIWARLAGASGEEGTALAIREIFAGANARAALPKLLETMRAFRPALVVRDSVEFGALIAAESAGVRHARVAVHLVSFEDMIPGLAAEPLAAMRAAQGLAPDDGASLRSEPCFSAFPAALDAPPADSARTPPPFRARMPEEALSPAHSTWASGTDSRRLLYITFGTIAGSMARLRHVYRIALDAVAELPVRAVLTTGPGIEAGALGEIPSNVRVEAWIPQRDLLAHASAVVCHGGSGTVRGALAAGLPLVVVPLGADQPYNAQRIAAVGAGLAVPNADVSALRTAIERVLVDAELRAGARRIADEIAALPPLERAIDAMEAIADAR
jgi:UDP:flavonoid glycosyltransferase YjiC (YdhE family)